MSQATTTTTTVPSRWYHLVEVLDPLSHLVEEVEEVVVVEVVVEEVVVVEVVVVEVVVEEVEYPSHQEEVEAEVVEGEVAEVLLEDPHMPTEDLKETHPLNSQKIENEAKPLCWCSKSIKE